MRKAGRLSAGFVRESCKEIQVQRESSGGTGDSFLRGEKAETGQHRGWTSVSFRRFTGRCGSEVCGRMRTAEEAVSRCGAQAGGRRAVRFPAERMPAGLSGFLHEKTDCPKAVCCVRIYFSVFSSLGSGSRSLSGWASASISYCHIWVGTISPFSLQV